MVSAPQTEPSDEQLMLAYAQGDARAFPPLYERHKGGIYRYLLRQMHNAAGADELAQDVWMNAINARQRYAVEAKFTTWLYTIAHNRLMDFFRSNKVVALGLVKSFDEGEVGEVAADPHEHIAAPAQDAPESRAHGSQVARRMLECLGALPANQREAFLLQEESGMSIADIAAACGVGMETAKSRLRYAMAKLRDCLQDFLEPAT